MNGKMNWDHVTEVPSKDYVCSYCNNKVASNQGWLSTIVIANFAEQAAVIYLCPHCTNPTYFTKEGFQVPRAAFGVAVSGINDKKIETLYNEARRAYSVSSFTAVVLCCRKLLMHLAVSEGAKEGQSFLEYVDYLDKNNSIPKGARAWVDKIREKGNEANHDIVIMDEPTAKLIISFSEMLLKILYEFPSKIV